METAKSKKIVIGRCIHSSGHLRCLLKSIVKHRSYVLMVRLPKRNKKNFESLFVDGCLSNLSV